MRVGHGLGVGQRRDGAEHGAEHGALLGGRADADRRGRVLQVRERPQLVVGRDLLPAGDAVLVLGGRGREHGQPGRQRGRQGVELLRGRPGARRDRRREPGQQLVRALGHQVERAVRQEREVVLAGGQRVVAGHARPLGLQRLGVQLGQQDAVVHAGRADGEVHPAEVGLLGHRAGVAATTCGEEEHSGEHHRLAQPRSHPAIIPHSPGPATNTLRNMSRAGRRGRPCDESAPVPCRRLQP